MTAPVSEVGLLRLVAQGLVQPAADPREAVRHLLAAQGQDLPGALTSVALRSRPGADVRAALDDGALVRSWPMRGTLHLLAAADLGWLLELCGARPRAGAARRRAALGLTEQDVARAADVAGEALAAGPLPRADLLAALTAGGVDVGGQRGYHVLWWLAQTGLTVLGPMCGAREQAFVLARDRVPAATARTRAQALAELALRYVTGHGPATDADLARWADLPLRDVRAGLAAVRDRLGELPGGLLLDPAVPPRLERLREQAEAVHLLPGFDEFVLGYAGRADVLDPEHAERICPGRNGVFRPTVVAGGRVVGTWSRDRRGALQVEPFGSWSPALHEAVQEAGRDGAATSAPPPT